MGPTDRIHEPGRQSPVHELDLHETATDPALGVTPYATNTNTTPPFNQCVPNLDRAPEFEVKWDSEYVQDPRSWPTWYKVFTVTTVSLGATVVSLFSTLYTSGIPGLQAEFHVSKLVALLGLTTYLLGMAAGSLIVAPMSESLGRRPLYIASMAAFLVLVLPSALAESITTIIATRFFGGFFGSTMMSNSPATVNDIVSDKHRALALGFWSIGPANGPVYGPLIGGFVYQYMGWRWTNWIVLIVGGVVFVLLASVKETYAPVLLRRRAAERSKATRDNRWWTRYDHGQGLWPLLKINLYRPLKMMCTEPICMFWNTYIGIVYATLYLCFVAYPIAFQQERGWAPGIGGLAFLGIGCGTLIPIAAEPLLRRIVNLHQKDPATGNVKPEARVSVVCIGAVLLAVGQLWFAWTCRPGTHWIVPILAGVPYGAGNACTFIYANNYMAQSYGIYAASALAGNMVVRSIMGACLPLAGPSILVFFDFPYQTATAINKYHRLQFWFTPYFGQQRSPAVMCLACFKFWHKDKKRDVSSTHSAQSSNSLSVSNSLSADSLRERLWTEAYHALEAGEKSIVEAYEELLAHRLKNISRDSGSLGSPEITPETLKTPDQLKRFIDAGLEESKKIAAVKRNIEKFNQIFLPVKEVMSVVVLAAPQAAIPWSCVSFSLQILANPLTESSINREGITYVLSTMDWYCELVGLLIDDENRSKMLRDELEKQIVELYKRLLLYQMKSVCRYYRSQILVLLGDVFKIDDWTGELTGVKEAEDQVRARLGQYQSSSICDSLKTLARAMQDQTNQIQDLSSLIQKQYQAQQDRDKHRDRENCLIDFRQTVDPHHEKDRIQIDKGGLLRDAYSWVLNHDTYRRWHEETHHEILWIKGDPGKGKTMLICGIIDELETDPIHTLSYFFCQATETTLNNATAVLRGLIYGLTKRYPQVDRHIYDKYKDGGGKAAFEGDSAWGVMCGIMNAILGDPMMNGVLLIVDALDECVEGRQKLLDFICERSKDSRARWIVSSRNWREIETNLERITERTSALSLELNSDLVSHAVRMYIRRKVDKLAEKQPYHDDLKLRNHVEKHLNDNSSDTFLWVALVCNALRQDNIIRRDHVIGPKGVLQKFPKGLDKLYKRMFQYISGTMDADLCKDVLAVTSILERSVTSLELCSIMGLSQHFDGKVETLQDAVRCCGSFLSLRDGTVYFVHQSARDFLLNEKEDTFDNLFPGGVEDLHWAVCSRSLGAMSKVIRRNIYELQDISIARKDIIMPKPSLLASVAYSCTFWMKHLGESNPASYIKDYEVVNRFLRIKFLYWLEALALLGELPQAVQGIQKLQNMIRAKPSSKDESIADLVDDANRFLLEHKEMIAEYPLQIYESALLFSPEESVIRKHFFEDHAPEWISIMPGLDMTWDTRLQSLTGDESHIYTVIYSPDGQWILSGYANGTVKLWQAESGNLVHTYDGFGEEQPAWSESKVRAGVQSVAFSGDSQTFTAASSNGVIKVWDLKTNQGESFRGHEEALVVTTMAISPDGRTLAYDLGKKGVHIWSMDKEISTRTIMADIADTFSLSFTTDGRCLASSSRSDKIKIWDTLTGDCKQEIDHEARRGVEISGDGQLIAAWSSAVHNWGIKTSPAIYILETKTGRLVRKLEHSGMRFTLSINFSKNGRLLAASTDKDIYIYNTATGDLTWKTSIGESYSTSLAFSPDHERLTTACVDMTIKIWDLAKGNKSMATGGSARSLCYSDELLFAAYYPDCQEITAWGRLTEHDVEVQRFHADNVDILAMSKYHQKVASASSSGQVTVWETKTGAHTQLFGANSVDAKGDNINDDIDDETGGLVEKITSLAFRNSFQLACGGWETIRILNISDGTIAQEHYEADGYVELMEFSADGQWLAYKSRDRYRHYSLRIWNTATGKRFLLSVAEPFRRNTDSLSFSMDGQLLVSSSYDVNTHMDNQVRKISTTVLSITTLDFESTVARQHTVTIWI
ncbi:hypothetical protein CaCOL14_008564 [Colletotrichum acutatum]